MRPRMQQKSLEDKRKQPKCPVSMGPNPPLRVPLRTRDPVARPRQNGMFPEFMGFQAMGGLLVSSAMLKAWAQWKKRCALDLCSDHAQRMLRAFAGSRFMRCLERCPTAQDSPAHESPWHLFETYATVTATRGGKRYKDWIFARERTSGRDPLSAIEGGASLIMRDAVREFVRAECSPRGILSLDRPIGCGDAGSVTLLDLLPAQMDPASEVALREYERLAREHARELFPGLSGRERIVLAAKEAGLSLAHGSVEEAAGCRKSCLNTAYHDLLARICMFIKTEYSGDDPESVLTLALMTVRELVHEVLRNAGSDGKCARLFELAGEHYLELAQA